MEIPYEYAYLIFSLSAGIPWAIIFIWRKDLRREMLLMGAYAGSVSLMSAYFWHTHDWWLPETITGTRVGIEDVLLGFFGGGIAAVLYETIFFKRHTRASHVQHGKVLYLFLIAIAVITVLFTVFQITSFIAYTVAMVLTGTIILLLRPDLWKSALITGTLFMLISMPAYYFMMFLFPGWVDKTYLFDYLSGITITGIPIEDLVFNFLMGFIVGPYYEYWQSKRLKPAK